MKMVEEFVIINFKNSYFNLVNIVYLDLVYLKFCYNIIIFEVF